MMTDPIRKLIASIQYIGGARMDEALWNHVRLHKARQPSDRQRSMW